MENLTEKVYESTLAVEAHMVCDLLSQAGISARVDGEFLQSAGGEIPLGNICKVRVDPARAAEAREVIADWEKLQTSDSPTPTPAAPHRSRFKSPLWFIGGFIVGAGLVLFMFRDRLAAPAYELDRNHDGRTDFRWLYDLSGAPTGYEEDDDFDGKFEWLVEADEDTLIRRAVLDADGDGRPEQVTQYRDGVVVDTEFYFASGGRIVKRLFYKMSLPDYAEFDDDGDGTFERRVKYDAHGDPAL